MTTFPFDETIPASGNNPSVDQPTMKLNNASNVSIWEVEHVGFDSDNGGTHLQTGFQGFSAGVIPSDLPDLTPASVAYPAAGIANPTNAGYYFKNAIGTFPLTLIRAYASILVATSATVPINGFNYGVITQIGTGRWTVVLPANIVKTSNFGVIVSGYTSANGTTAQVAGYSNLGYNVTSFEGSFNMTFVNLNGSNENPNSFTFMVLQY